VPLFVTFIVDSFEIYRIAGKFGEFGKSSMIRQTKPIQTSTYNYNLLAESIHSPNFFCQMLKTRKFAKLYPCQTFPLYGTVSEYRSSCESLSVR